MIQPNPTQIPEIAAREGVNGVARWLDELGDLNSDLPATESLYWKLKDISPGAAFSMAYRLRAIGAALPAVLQDLEAEKTRNPGVWVKGFAHLLSPHFLSRAQLAFKSGDILCGLQRFYCVGSGPSAVIFNSFSEFDDRIRGARPGDEFMLVSIQQLADRDALLAPTKQAVQEWLDRNPTEEVFWIDAGNVPPTLEIIYKGAEQDKDVDQIFASNRKPIAVPFLWTQTFLIDAKRPNDREEIPIGGAY